MSVMGAGRDRIRCTMRAMMIDAMGEWVRDMVRVR